MQNKFTGWLIFLQLGYVSAFVVLGTINAASRGAVVNWIAVIRHAVGLPNTHVRFNDYVSYPLAFTSPINTLLAMAFFWTLLRKNAGIDLTRDFFSIINAVYVASSAWIFTTFVFSALRG
jgi:hypothetical protein